MGLWTGLQQAPAVPPGQKRGGAHGSYTEGKDFLGGLDGIFLKEVPSSKDPLGIDVALEALKLSNGLVASHVAKVIYFELSDSVFCGDTPPEFDGFATDVSVEFFRRLQFLLCSGQEVEVEMRVPDVAKKDMTPTNSRNIGFRRFLKIGHQ